MKQKGVSTSAVTIAVVVTAVVVMAGVAIFFLGGPKVQPTGGIGFPMNATATVRLHDAYTVNVADWVENYMPDIAGVSITVSGTVTVNSFSATNITVKLHNKDAGEWITIIEGQTITDMTVPNDLVDNISAGTYDKVSVYVGTVTADVSWENITVTGTVDLSQYGLSGTFDIDYTHPDGSFSQAVAINQEFVISFSQEVTVDVGENQVFDVDTNAPINPDIAYSIIGGFSFGVGAGELDKTNMEASGL